MPQQMASEDFSEIPAALGVPYTCWGQSLGAAFTGACACDGGAQRGFDGIDRHVGVFGTVYTQQEGVGVTAGYLLGGSAPSTWAAPFIGWSPSNGPRPDVAHRQDGRAGRRGVSVYAAER